MTSKLAKSHWYIPRSELQTMYRPSNCNRGCKQTLRSSDTDRVFKHLQLISHPIGHTYGETEAETDKYCAYEVTISHNFINVKYWLNCKFFLYVFFFFCTVKVTNSLATSLYSCFECDSLEKKRENTKTKFKIKFTDFFFYY